MKKRFLGLAGVGTLLVGASFGSAALITTQTDVDVNTGATVDGTISTNEYGAANAYQYTGGGTGFGGTLGSGKIYMQSNLSTLFVGADIAGGLGGNIVAVFLDVKTGGQSDSTMDDEADGGRDVASNLTRDVDDVFPSGTGIRGGSTMLADYVLEFGNGFTNLFALNAGNTDGHLTFIAPTAAGTGGNSGAGSREASISWSSLGVTSGPVNVDFFAVLISDTNFSSNEGIPGQGIANNPGFDNSANGGGAVTWANFDRFVAVPEPATAGMLVLGGVAMLVRRRRQT